MRTHLTLFLSSHPLYFSSLDCSIYSAEKPLDMVATKCSACVLNRINVRGKLLSRVSQVFYTLLKNTQLRLFLANTMACFSKPCLKSHFFYLLFIQKDCKELEAGVSLTNCTLPKIHQLCIVTWSCELFSCNFWLSLWLPKLFVCWRLISKSC